MADQFREQINTARRAGYSDDELIGYLKEKDPRIAQALGEGYKPAEILEYLAPKLSTGEEVVRKGKVALRGVSEALAPVTAGATAGLMMGGPVGAGVGALAGGLAVPATDVLVQGYNKLTGSNVRLPSQVISSMIPGPRAETPTERVLQASTGALTGTGGSVTAGRGLAEMAKIPAQAGQAPTVAPSIAAIGQEAARRPVGQMVTAPIATAMGQTTTELTDSPLAGLAASLATGTTLGVRPTKRNAVPTAEELTARAKANYDILDNSKFELDNAQFVQHMKSLPAKLRSSSGYDPRTMPDVDAAFAQLTSGGAKNVQELDTLRTIIKNGTTSVKASERKAASQLLDEFDDYVLNAPASATVVADKKAMQAWKDARADYAKMKKSEMITDILDNADVAQGSKEASIASQLSSLAKNQKKMRVFTPDEQEAIREAAKGGNLQVMLRTVGKLAPMTPAAAIFTAVNPFGAYTAAAGFTAKTFAEQRRMQQANRLAEQMRLGEAPKVIEGPLANEPVFFSRSVQNMLGPVQQNQNALNR
jgi:hypothetical protein